MGRSVSPLYLIMQYKNQMLRVEREYRLLKLENARLYEEIRILKKKLDRYQDNF